ncbi:hypothetical protein M422DRAFT_257398 [Sphaerobolus stellatus SS14]|uniref:Uncharacterized protein n=1 Tax=Sphaerobolus stellatus (strain SS14) TaxID=990650 RepID=A0A0C9VPM6_SPHS4|nr:hypothetical protein M422DRAFT_257398 [Sphaerobolus stellatus SS14]
MELRGRYVRFDNVQSPASSQSNLSEDGGDSEDPGYGTSIFVDEKDGRESNQDPYEDEASDEDSDAPSIPASEPFECPDYVAKNLTGLLAIINRLTYNFADYNNEALRDVQTWLGMSAVASSPYKIHQRIEKDTINKLCRAQGIQGMTCKLYDQRCEELGGEAAYVEHLRQWAHDNPVTVTMGRAMKDTDLGPTIRDATEKGTKMMRLVGAKADIAFVVIAWSRNAAADPRETTFGSCSDARASQTLGDFHIMPQMAAAVFQTHDKLADIQVYAKMFQETVDTVKQRVGELPMAEIPKQKKMKTAEKIKVTVTSKKLKAKGKAGDDTSSSIEVKDGLLIFRDAYAKVGPIPDNWEFDHEIEELKLFDKNPEMRQYFTSLFRDALYMVQGSLPLGVISKNDPKADLKTDVRYTTATWFRNIFEAGLRIVNWPVGSPLPAKLRDPGIPSPQSWKPHQVARVMKQSCARDRSKRLGFICRRHDTKRMPFITFAPDDDGNPPDFAYDFPDDTYPDTPLYSEEDCPCSNDQGCDIGSTRFLKQVVEKEALKHSGKSAQPKARNNKEPVPTQSPMDVEVEDDGRYPTPPPIVEPVRTKGKGSSKAQHIEAEPITRRPRATASTSTGAQRPSTRDVRPSSQLQRNTAAPDAVPNARNTTAPVAVRDTTAPTAPLAPVRPSRAVSPALARIPEESTEGRPRASPAPVVEGAAKKIRSRTQAAAAAAATTSGQATSHKRKDIPSGAEGQDRAAAKKQRKDPNNNTLPSFPNAVVQPATPQPPKGLPPPPAAPPQPPTHTGAPQGSTRVRPIEHVVSDPMGKKVELPGWSVPMDSLTWCNKAGPALTNALARPPASTPDYKKKVHDVTSMVIRRFIERYKRNTLWLSFQDVIDFAVVVTETANDVNTMDAYQGAHLWFHCVVEMVSQVGEFPGMAPTSIEQVNSFTDWFVGFLEENTLNDSRLILLALLPDVEDNTPDADLYAELRGIM